MRETKDFRPMETRRKLAELRMKTDADLATLLDRTIERGFRALDQGDYFQAEARGAAAGKLLPLLRNVAVEEFDTLRTHFERLQAELCKAAEASALLATW